MDVSEQVSKFQDFFENVYSDELLKAANKGENRVTVDFKLFSQNQLELAQDLLDDPINTIKAGEISIEKLSLQGMPKNFKLRFKNLPASQNILIRNVRSKHIGKLLQLEGIVRQKSDVRPQVTSAKFECPSCGNIMTVLQVEQKFKEPGMCPGCARKGSFRLLSKELVDAQRVVLEEATEDLDGGEQPKRFNVFLKDDLVSPITDKKTNPGSKVLITGIIKEVPINLATGGKSVQFDLLLESNHIEPMQEDYASVVITPEEEKNILTLSKDPLLLKKFVNSFAPSIYGYERIKEALMLQILGGVIKPRSDGVRTRGDIHILLIGDPGAAKSQLLKRIEKIAPKSRFVSGKGASGAGLTAAVVKDEFLKGWALEAGALVLAHKGIACIDELDKMTDEDRSAMHEGLEQQTITISKANIQATLRCETTVLAAANPKFGRFDPYEILAKQIDLPPALMSRFDLIFPVRDVPDKDKDDKIATFILKLHQDVSRSEDVELTTDFMKKYFSYARNRVHPRLSDEAMEEIRSYYVKIRNMASSSEGGVKSVPITPRQLEALVRLSEASAKLRLSSEVTTDDAKKAIEILHYTLSQIGLDPDTGKLDIDRITTGITASQRSHIVIVREVIKSLEDSFGKQIPEDEIKKECSQKGIEDSKIEEVLEKLKRTGDLFEPKKGFYSRVDFKRSE